MSDRDSRIVFVGRPRHTDKDIEKLLRSVEAQGWRVTKGKGYFRIWCPCDHKHVSSVALTPSGSKYLLNLKAKLKRGTCWKADL